MNIAVIGFWHTEMSLCISKYMALQGNHVDYYCICDYIRDKGYQAGYEYKNVSKRLGIVPVTEEGAPEIIHDTKGINVKHFLLRILSFSNKLWFINKIILRIAFHKIRKKHYDAILIIGQMPWVKYFHDSLRKENITHLFHEIGSHQNGTLANPLMCQVIKDRTKVILPSLATAERFWSIPEADKKLTTIIPIGKHESLLLYERDVKIDIKVDLRKTTFLFYGFIKPYKGLALLADAIKLIEKESERFNLIIAGSGYDANLSFFQSLKNCQVINRYITNEEVMKLNRLCTAVLLPYKTASQSGIVLTTFMYGKPIIGTKVGALIETIKDGYNGILVEKDNAKKYAEAMLQIVDNPEFVKKLSKGAMLFGHGDEYDWNVIAKKTVEFIK